MTDTQTPRISVLDHSPVSSGAPLTAALQHSTALARLAEERGYFRYWVAEHHGRPWMALRSRGTVGPSGTIPGTTPAPCEWRNCHGPGRRQAARGRDA